MGKFISILLASASVCLVLSAVNCEKNFDFYFVKMAELNETSNEIYNYKLKKVEKVNDTSFKASVEFDQLQDLDDSWHVSIETYHNADGEEVFEKPYLKVPKTAACEFMKSYYKKHLYEKLKNYGNAPDPDACPIVKNKYTIQNFIFNGDRYKPLARPGMWRIDVFISKDDVTLRGVQYFVVVQNKDE